MRTSDARYILNVTRQVLGLHVKMQIEGLNRLRKSNESVRRDTLPLEPGDFPIIFEVAMEMGELTSETVKDYFSKSIAAIIEKMTVETLGKVVSYGVARGDVDLSTFRKTSYLNYASPRWHYHGLNGRRFLEIFAGAVVACAIWDYLQVSQVAKQKNISWQDAGQIYLGDAFTQTRSFENSFTRSVVGTGP